MSSSGQPLQGCRLNPLFPLAATAEDRKPFAPLQAVQHFASQVQSQVRSKLGHKAKDTADKQSVSDAIADAASATRAKPSESQHQARRLVQNLSSKGLVLAKTSQGSQGSDLGAVSPAATVSKEELGRATWTLLHTLAVQYPQTPTKQQQKDVKTLVDVLTRIYPCTECAQHFGEIVKIDPPNVSSGPALQQWMCRVHNVVNKSIGKRTFNCRFVEARWGALDCGEKYACDMQGAQKK
ncbi:hypothetical protein ABBQ32_009173 [Trebouxia sp. C0010 RCD-2024]